MRYRQNQNESNTPEHAMGILLIVRHPSLIESRRLCSRKLVMFTFPKSNYTIRYATSRLSVFLQKQFTKLRCLFLWDVPWFDIRVRTYAWFYTQLFTPIKCHSIVRRIFAEFPSSKSINSDVEKSCQRGYQKQRHDEVTMRSALTVQWFRD